MWEKFVMLLQYSSYLCPLHTNHTHAYVQRRIATPRVTPTRYSAQPTQTCRMAGLWRVQPIYDNSLC